MNTPVALFIFNRPDTTARVLDALRAVRPRTVFVIADGARADEPEDAARCAATRACIETIDWECEVVKQYADRHLGLRRRVESGLDWLFENADEGIILEDDCVPEPAFFRFCEELLTRYRDTPRVMGISGTNFHFGQYAPPYSYHFSRYPLVWGWATWKRAWAQYDATMEAWANLRGTDWLASTLESPAAVRYWDGVFQKNFESPGSWDYAWMLATWLHEGLHVCPSVNLVSNIGFRSDASHTRNVYDPLANVASYPLEFPLRHPPAIVRDEQADALTEENVYSGKEFLKPLFRAMRAHIHSRTP